MATITVSHSDVLQLIAAAPLKNQIKEQEECDQLPTAINFRDLAQADSSKIKSGRVYRCSELFKLEVFNNYKIKTVIDMRKKHDEVETHPVYCMLAADQCLTDDGSTIPTIVSVNFIKTHVGLAIVSRMPRRIWWQLIKGKMAGLKACDIVCPAVADPKCMGFSVFYKILVDKAGDAVAESLRVFADKKNFPVFMHCTHGKDRTGILAFFLEAICGVGLEDMQNDYSVSEENLKDAKAKYCLPLSEALIDDPVLSADAKNISELLNHINNKYGSLEGYFNFIGLTEEELEAIKTNLMQE